MFAELSLPLHLHPDTAMASFRAYDSAAWHASPWQMSGLQGARLLLGLSPVVHWAVFYNPTAKDAHPERFCCLHAALMLLRSRS